MKKWYVFRGRRCIGTVQASTQAKAIVLVRFFYYQYALGNLGVASDVKGSNRKSASTRKPERKTTHVVKRTKKVPTLSRDGLSLT